RHLVWGYGGSEVRHGGVAGRELLGKAALAGTHPAHDQREPGHEVSPDRPLSPTSSGGLRRLEGIGEVGGGATFGGCRREVLWRRRGKAVVRGQGSEDSKAKS